VGRGTGRRGDRPRRGQSLALLRPAFAAEGLGGQREGGGPGRRGQGPPHRPRRGQREQSVLAHPWRAQSASSAGLEPARLRRPERLSRSFALPPELGEPPRAAPGRSARNALAPRAFARVRGRLRPVQADGERPFRREALAPEREVPRRPGGLSQRQRGRAGGPPGGNPFGGDTRGRLPRR